MKITIIESSTSYYNVPYTVHFYFDRYFGRWLLDESDYKPFKRRAEMRRAKDCIINEYFRDGKNSEFYRNEYCKLNCGYKCHKKQEYKKLK